MSSRLASLRPTRREAVDVAGAVSLTIVALVGFRSAFGGIGFLLIGATAAVLGAVVGHLVVRVRPGVLPAAAAALAIFLLVGMPLVAGAQCLLRVIPTPAAFEALVDGLVRGWARLLTTLPPTGGVDNVFAVPYLCGFVAGFAGVQVAYRRRWLLPVVVPAALVMVTAILFGTREPVDLLVQGGGFAVLAFTWMSLRWTESREVILTGRRRWSRVVAVLATLGVTLAGATVVGPRLPLVGASERVVLRDDVVPPFDPRDYGSPLAAFRKYRLELEQGVLFTIDRIPDGASHVRLAVMDDYDNLVWTVANRLRSGGGYFERAGSTLPVDAQGVKYTASVTVGALRGVWVPGIGVTDGVELGGARGELLQSTLRYNSFSGVLATPAGLDEGDVIRLSGVVTQLPDEGVLMGARIDNTIAVSTSQLPPDFGSYAASLVTGASTSYEQAKMLERALRKGAYSDGDKTVVSTPPGHSLARLLQFIDGQLVGNGEQYAASMAVMLQTLQIPSRVVLGFAVEEGATDLDVTGGDVEAWVEVPFEGIGWVPFFPTPPITNEPQPDVQLQRPRPRVETQIPPPVSNPPSPTTVPQQNDEEEDQAPPERVVESEEGGQVPVVLLIGGAILLLPVLLLALVTLLAVVRKRRRRRRRRTRGEPHQRIAGGWSEIIDLARDQGRELPVKATRREAARALGAPAPELAREADAKVFGRTDPTDDDAVLFWEQVDVTLDSLNDGRGLPDRLRAAASRTSLKTSDDRRQEERSR
jgi:hypothetical protein